MDEAEDRAKKMLADAGAVQTDDLCVATSCISYVMAGLVAADTADDSTMHRMALASMDRELEHIRDHCQHPGMLVEVYARLSKAVMNASTDAMVAEFRRKLDMED